MDGNRRNLLSCKTSGHLAETLVILTKTTALAENPLELCNENTACSGKGGTRTSLGTQVHLESYLGLWAKSKYF